MDRRKIFLVSAVILLAFILLLSVFRDGILSVYLNRKLSQLGEKYHTSFTVDRAGIRWLAAVELKGVCIVPVGGDTLLQAGRVYLSVSPLKLLLGRIAVNDVEIQNLRVSLIRHDSLNNYGFLLRRTAPGPDTVKRPVDFAALAGRLMRTVFDKVPKWMQIRNLEVIGITNGHRIMLRAGKVDLEDHRFRAEISVTEEDVEQQWIVNGRIDRGEKAMMFHICRTGREKLSLPFLGYKWKADVGMDSVRFTLVQGAGGRDSLTVTGQGAIYGLRVSHEAIAARPVDVDTLSADYSLTFGKDFIRYDSASRILFNRLELHPSIKYRPYPSAQVTLIVHKPPFPAGDLFSSLPRGLFNNLEGIRVRGELSFSLDFFADFSEPDSLVFDMDLKGHRFGVLSYGSADLHRLDSAFFYAAWDRNILVRTFEVGPGNPTFRPLDRISPLLRYAVMTSEDGGFYQHRGFLQEAFRESLVQNIRERRFARGGSTITMQMVKNVFLSRNKTIARKVEEALLVWLIENQEIVTKDRMFEVYLNIIEWGPGIYGAGEAAQFYFDKDVSKLTPAEAIFLASVIPRPKGFRYSFDDNGHLRPALADYYRLVSGKMLAKGWLSQDEYDHLVPDVTLRGAARLMLKKKDSVEGGEMMRW